MPRTKHGTTLRDCERAVNNVKAAVKKAIRMKERHKTSDEVCWWVDGIMIYSDIIQELFRWIAVHVGG